MRLSLLSILAVVLAGCGVPGGDPGITTTTTAPTSAPTSAPTTTPPPTSAPATTTTAPATTTTTSPVTEVTITVAGDQITGGGRVGIIQGAEVRLTVEADVSDEVHIHGYDLLADVTPETPAVIEFTADIPGIFEVELESTHRLLVELEVAP